MERQGKEADMEAASRLWNSYGGEAEWLRLIEFIDPDSSAVKSVVAQAKAKAPDGEFPAYVPPPGWEKSVGELVDVQVEAIYETLRERRIGYAVERWDSRPPAQVIRTHEEVLCAEGIGGPCLDLVLTMAACLEHVGIQPLVVVLAEKSSGRRHAILGYRTNEILYGPGMQAQCIPHIARGDEKLVGLVHEEEIRTLKNQGDLEFLNCTGFTGGEHGAFGEAKGAGLGYIESGDPATWQKYKDHWQILFALDVKGARNTALTREMQAYLAQVRTDALTLPPAFGFPADVDFKRIGVQVKVRRGPRPFSEAEARAWRTARREGFEESVARVYERCPWISLEELEREAERPLDWDREVRGRLKRAVILGDPGFGKTWLLKHEALKLAEEGLKKLEHYPLATDDIHLPIFLLLAQLAAHTDKQGRPLPLEKALLTALKGRYPIGKELEAWIKRNLNSERVVLLLDALDEVIPSKRQQKLREHLDEFVRKYGQTRILLTSRLVGYPGPPFPLPQDGELELLPFDPRQQRHFVKLWFSGRPERGEAFLGGLREIPQLQGLAQVPLLLALMCRLFDEQDQWPRSRAELYAGCISGILRRWWKNPCAEDPYMDAKLELVEELALVLFLDEKELFSLRELRSAVKTVLQKRPDLREELGKEAAALVRELEEDGLLIKAGAGVNPPYLFLHLTFQEYLAACALAQRTNSVDLHGQRVPEWLKIVQPRLFNSRWREVILLVAAEADNATPLLSTLWAMPEDIWLGKLLLTCSCLAQAKMVEGKIAAEIIDAVLELFNKMRLQVERHCFFRSYEITTLLYSARQHGLYAVRSLRKKLASSISELVMKGYLNKDEIDKRLHSAFEFLETHNWSCPGDFLSYIWLLVQVIAKADPRRLIHILESAISQGLGGELLECLMEAAADAAPTPLLNVALEKTLSPAAALSLADRGVDIGIFLMEMLRNALIMARMGFVQHTTVVARCAEILGVLKEKRAVPLLLNLLLPESEGRRTKIVVRAAFALAEIGDARAVPALLKAALHFQEWDELEASAWALEKIGLPALEPLVEILRRGRPRGFEELLTSALRIIRSSGVPATLAPKLEPLLSATDPELQLLAATAFAYSGDASGAKILLDLLKYKHTARDAILALGGLKERQAVEAIGKLLETADIDAHVARAAIWALESIGDYRAQQTLAEFARRADVDLEIKTEAVASLTRICPPDPPVIGIISSLIKEIQRHAELLWRLTRGKTTFRVLLTGEVEVLQRP